MIAEGERLHTVRLDIDARRPAALWLLSDMHIGHVAFDAERFERDREAALKARARVVIVGDAMETVVTGSKVANLGGFYDQTMDIRSQRDALVSYMDGLRCVAMLDGNHERRLVRVANESPLEWAAERVARRQHMPCEYMADPGFLDIRCGTQRYVVGIHHGEGSGPTTFFRYLMRDFPGADVYAAGHTHELTYAETIRHTVDGPQRVRCVRTGAYVDNPSYARKTVGPYGIPATGSWLLHMYPDRHHLRLEQLADRG